MTDRQADRLTLIGGAWDGLEIRLLPAGPGHVLKPDRVPHTIQANELTYRLEHAGDGAPSRDDQGRIRYRLEAAL